MAGKIEEADSTRACGLKAPGIRIDGTRQPTKAGISLNGDLKLKALQRLLEQRDVVVRIGEPADLARISFIADKQCNAFLGERRRQDRHQNQKQPDEYILALRSIRYADHISPTPINI
jgi:hypothetical protein